MKTYIIFLSLLSWHFISYAQPLIEENFIYPPGVLTELTTSWFEEPVGGYDVNVKEGNLFYPGYASSGAGNMIFLDGGSYDRSGIQRTFPLVSGDSKKLFVSFLLNVQDTLELSSAGICRVKQDNQTLRFYIYLSKAVGTGKYRIGLSKTGASVVYDPSLRNTGETYLITGMYQFNLGYDTLKLWINPDLSGNIPAPNIVFCPAQTDAVNFRSINFVQTSGSGNTYIDGLRIDTSWSQSPLPVELSAFTAELVNGEILLKWKTETEIDNYGFDIEKLTDKEESWRKIGFIEGHGNCNTPKYYSFSDRNIFNYGSIKYRLRQIDNDGGFSYSTEVVYTPEMPLEFTLHQNYPNPFNSSTKIRYHIKEIKGNDAAEIEIKLYNILGVEVACLVNEYKKPGIYELSFDSGKYNLSAGVYLYTLSVKYSESEPDFSVKKLLLLK